MTAKELQDRFSFSYGERDQSYTLVLYGRNQSPAVGFTLSFRDRVMRAQEFVQRSVPPKKWEPKPGSSCEKYYLKDHEFSDLCQLEQMMNNLTRFLNYDMIDFNQKLFNEESRREILRLIIKDANWRGLESGIRQSSGSTVSSFRLRRISFNDTSFCGTVPGGCSRGLCSVSLNRQHCRSRLPHR